MRDGERGSCCLPRARRKRLSIGKHPLCNLQLCTGDVLGFLCPSTPKNSIAAPTTSCYKEVGARPSLWVIACRGSVPGLPAGRGEAGGEGGCPQRCGSAVSAVLVLGATTLVFLPHQWAYGGGGRISPWHQELHQQLHSPLPHPETQK